MIKAEEAKNIALFGRLEYLERRIRERAGNHYRSVNLIGEFRLTNDDKKVLEENGYTITVGESGKYGKFDIINW